MSQLIKRPARLPTRRGVVSLGHRMTERVASVGLLRWPDVPYGPRPEQSLFLWELDDLAPRDGWPAVLLLQDDPAREPETLFSVGPWLARRGVLATTPKETTERSVADVHQAIDFLRHQQVDARRLALWGEGEGGALALAAVRERPELVRSVVVLGLPDAAHLDGVGPACRLDIANDRAAHRRALQWLVESLDPAPRGSKWKIRKKKNR